MSQRESWLAVVQDGDGPEEQETEIVTLEGRGHLEAGDVIELTDGRRITLMEPAAA